MPVASSFEYAVVRVVPRVERGEFVNAGVILYCRSLEFLETALALDRARLLALAPGTDVTMVEAHLEAVAHVCRGGAGAGPIGTLTQAERFRWLVAPRSTMIQCSPVHEGMCDDPREALADALRKLVQAS